MCNAFRALSFLCLLIAGIYSHGVWAESCNSLVGQMTINVQNITYLPTLPVNTQMTNIMADNGSGIHFSCDLQAPSASWKRVVYKQASTTGSPLVINGQHVFSTSLTGLGYSLGFQCSGGAIHYIDGSSSPAGNESTTVCDSAQMPGLLSQQEIIVKAYVTFYKTGDVPLESGNHANVPALPQVGNLYIEKQSSGDTGSVASSPVSIDLSALNIDIGASGSCQVTTSNINVNLGTVNKMDFKGRGTTAGTAQNFAIPVFCSTPTDIRIGFFGVTSDAAITDSLALTQQAGAASGVGVRLSYGNNSAPAPSAGTSVKINEASNLPVLKHITASSAASAEQINFTAQYVQTGDTVAAGRANSMATFALEYN